MVRRKLTGLILLGLILVGCSEDESVFSKTEIFTGALIVSRKWQGFPVERIDTVVFTVEGGTYGLKHTFDMNDFCNSQGRVSGFGRGTLTLIPTSYSTGSCDTVRFPQGEFKSVFGEDSLILERKQHVVTWEHEGQQLVDTLGFGFRLTK